MKTKKDFINWIKDQIKFYSPILGIDLHRIDVEEKQTTTYLEIGCTYPYLDSTIYFCNKSFEDFKSGKLTRDRILHELCHIITDPLYCKCNQRYVSKDEVLDERERLTDALAVIIRRFTK